MSLQNCGPEKLVILGMSDEPEDQDLDGSDKMALMRKHMGVAQKMMKEALAAGHVVQDPETKMYTRKCDPMTCNCLPVVASSIRAQAEKKM